MVFCALLLGACAQVPVEPQDEIRAESVVERAPAAKGMPAAIEDAPIAALYSASTASASSATPATPSAPAIAELQDKKAPPPPGDLWVRVRAGFQIPDVDNGRVRMWEKWYSERPEYVEFMIELASRYLYHVVQEVERRNMPTELALLPMIESAYNPYAYSRSHASGMWQFIRSTGKSYGLKQTFWYDGRRDAIAATNAALDYLQDLHKMFGSWDLALAAYNLGENGLNRAIKRNRARKQPITYDKLRMPRETRNYFPKLQAVKNIISDPARFGLTLADIPNRPYFDVVTTDRHIDVKVAAKLAEISIEEFRILNPAHNKPVIRTDGTETILLPVANVATFKKNLIVYEAPLVTWQIYKVKGNESLSRIAKKYGVSVAYLKRINGMSARGHVHPGDKILVPMRGSAEPYLPELPAPRIIRVRYYPQPKKKPDQPDTRTSAPSQSDMLMAQESAEKPHPLAAGETPPLEDGFVLARHPAE
jgi:membrane-bound lytic murein transglycosylase D